MLMAIIEYELNPGVEEEFRALIGNLLPRLIEVDGFISADPAQSLVREGYCYEISYWRDAASLERWAHHPDHLHAKLRGREALLKWYRIRVGAVTRDWSVGEVPGG